MTTEEAIKVLEIEKESYYGLVEEALCMALAALRAKEEAEKNEPLTLEELREMDGEPVWVVGPEPGWVLVNVKEETLFDSNTDYIAFDDYGSVWLAYRRKPEETPADG